MFQDSARYSGLKYPLISIIVPVYNVEPYLRFCLDSLVHQSYPNIEIVIIASESSDRSVEICMEYLEKFKQIILVHSEPNGLSDARNKGIDVANGKYICFIDSDDYVSLDFISILYSICVEYDCDIVQCNYLDVTESLSIGPCPSSEQNVSIYSGIEMCYNLYNDLYVPTVVVWSKLYRRELFDNIRYPVNKIHEDEATSYKVFYNAARVGVTSQKLYYYRQRSDGITGQAFSIKNLDYLDFLDEQLSFFKDNNERQLYALTLERYAKCIPTYIFNTKSLPTIPQNLMNNLMNRYKFVIRESLYNKYIPLVRKMHLILVWIFPRTKFTLNVLGQLRKYF